LDGVEEYGEFEELIVCAIWSGGQPFLEKSPGDAGASQSCLWNLTLGRKYNDA